MRVTPLALIPMLAAAAALAEPPRYTLELIEPIGGVDTTHIPMAINDLGWVAGAFEVSSPAFGYRTFLWKPGQPAVDIGQPTDALDLLQPVDINDDGLIVGEAQTDFGTSPEHAWSWRDGEFTVYEQFVAGRPGHVGGANDAGRVVGWANDGSFIGEQALEYMPDGSFVLMPPDGLAGSDKALAINNNDVVLGTEARGVFLWQDGDPDRMFLPPPSVTLTRFEPQDLNDLGDVVGPAAVAIHPEGRTAAVWLSGSGWRTFYAGGRHNVPLAINNNREVVGWTRDNTGGIGDHGWYWTEQDGYIPLAELIEPAGLWGVAIARDINNRGQIIVSLLSRPGGDTATGVLTPIEDACPADCDVDGELSLFDFLCFQNRFDAGDPAADCDGDGGLSIFDFLCFQNAFDAGCESNSHPAGLTARGR